MQRQGHVLFRVRSYKDYGKLSGRSVDDMIAGRAGRGGAVQGRPDGLCPVETSDADLPGWDSPLGQGAAGLAHRMLGHEL